MKNMYFWSIIKHQFKVCKNLSGEIAFFYIFNSENLFGSYRSLWLFSHSLIDMKFQNIVLLSK